MNRKLLLAALLLVIGFTFYRVLGTEAVSLDRYTLARSVLRRVILLALGLYLIFSKTPHKRARPGGFFSRNPNYIKAIGVAAIAVVAVLSLIPESKIIPVGSLDGFKEFVMNDPALSAKAEKMSRDEFGMYLTKASKRGFFFLALPELKSYTVLLRKFADSSEANCADIGGRSRVAPVTILAKLSKEEQVAYNKITASATRAFLAHENEFSDSALAASFGQSVKKLAALSGAHNGKSVLDIYRNPASNDTGDWCWLAKASLENWEKFPETDQLLYLRAYLAAE